MRRIAVTGASGFLGRRIVELALGRDCSVVATSRGRGPITFGRGITFHAAEITDLDALARAFDNCEVVIHCAALSVDWGPREAFRRINVEGTRTVVEAARRAGVRRLVHVSSTSVYFDFSDKLGLREDAALPRPANAYAASKQAAERIAGDFPGEVFVMRPRGLFGPGDPHLLPRLLQVSRRGPLPLLRGGAAKVDITEVGVAADAALAMAVAQASAAGIYNVSHGEPITVVGLVERLFSGLGRPLRWRRLPWPAVYAAARALELLARADPRHRAPPVTAYSLGLFAFSQTLDLTRVRQILRWQAPLSRDEAIERTIAAARGG